MPTSESQKPPEEKTKAVNFEVKEEVVSMEVAGEEESEVHPDPFQTSIKPSYSDASPKVLSPKMSFGLGQVQPSESQDVKGLPSGAHLKMQEFKPGLSSVAKSQQSDKTNKMHIQEGIMS